MTGLIHHHAMQRHFDRLAPRYNRFRNTDSEPVEYLRDRVADDPPSLMAEIGCGGGRYSLLLRRSLPMTRLVCCDINRAMLDETDSYLKLNDEQDYSLQLAGADSFSTAGGKFDCIVCFNAIHHFDPVSFLRHARRVLRPCGQIFIYTRLREQNESSIWGRYFPDFANRETRLYGREEIDRWVRELEELELDHVETFRFARRSSLPELLERVANRHYSTFEFYSDEELEDAIGDFCGRIARDYRDPSDLKWIDRNSLIQIRAGCE